MKISHIEHLGIAVKSIEESLPYYEKRFRFVKCYKHRKPWKIKKS